MKSYHLWQYGGPRGHYAKWISQQQKQDFLYLTFIIARMPLKFIWHRKNHENEIYSQEKEVICFQTVKYGKVLGRWGVTIQWRNLRNTTSAKWSRSTLSLISHVDTYPLCDVLRMALYHFGLFLQNPQHQSHQEKNKLRDSLQNIVLVLFRIVKAFKNKRSPRNYQEGIKETWWPTIMEYPGRDSRK